MNAKLKNTVSSSCLTWGCVTLLVIGMAAGTMILVIVSISRN